MKYKVITFRMQGAGALLLAATMLISSLFFGAVNSSNMPAPLKALAMFAQPQSVLAESVDYPYGCPGYIGGTMHVQSAVQVVSVWFYFADGGSTTISAYWNGSEYRATTTYPWASIVEASINFNGSAGSHSEWITCGGY